MTIHLTSCLALLLLLLSSSISLPSLRNLTPAHLPLPLPHHIRAHLMMATLRCQLHSLHLRLHASTLVPTRIGINPRHFNLTEKRHIVTPFRLTPYHGISSSHNNMKRRSMNGNEMHFLCRRISVINPSLITPSIRLRPSHRRHPLLVQ